MIPPKLALYLAWALALFLLWRDTKRRPDISLALWVPVLWIMRCGSRGVDYWLNGDDVGRLDPVVIAILIACGLVILLRRPCDWGAIVANNSMLFLFYAYLMASTLWVDEIENPLIKIFRPMGDLLMALIVATEINLREAIATLFRRCAYLLIPMSVVLVRYFHEMGTLQDKHWGSDIWCGVTTHKNPLGQLCIISTFAFFWQLVEARAAGKRLLRQYIPWFYLAMTVYLFNGGGNSNSRSSTAFICLAVGMASYLVLGRYRNRSELVVRSIVVSVVIIAAISVALELFGTSLQAMVAATQGKDPTLTDRTYLWRDVVRIGMQHPVLGSGYGGFWVPSLYSQLSPEVDNGPKEAHNGYLETFANLGLVGVALLACVIFQALRNATKTMQTDFEYGRLRLALLFMVLVMNYSEATFTVGNHLWWFGFLVIAVYARPWVAWPEISPSNVDEQRDDIHHKQEPILA